ncbi:IS3 family transposase [Amycolatopsis magusensis]|nr:IS3 family transposase [Amycolatopsis magusensis]
MIYRYRFISEHRATYGVKRLCQVLGVRRQGFHEWVAAEAARNERAEAEQQLVTMIATIHAKRRGTYGVPRITAELHRRGHTVNHKRVERLMREHGLAGITRRKRRSTTRPAAGPVTPVTDLIRRDFTAEKPGQRLVGESPACPPSTAGSTWPPSSTCTPARSSGTPWPPICAPTWSARRSIWLPPAA